MIGLADCNNFFVSCERTRNRGLEGRPVVVLSNNDGCVVARSNEAKRMGVKMGQPAFQLKDLINGGRLIALSGDHLFYRDLSLRVHDIFRRFAPVSTDYSIDEAFLDMQGVPFDHLRQIGARICETCMAQLHLPVTVGFAPSKTLAKIVTDACKKRGRSVGVLREAAEAIPVMEKVPIQDLWGVGRRLTKRLYLSGVHTVADFLRKDRHWVKAKMGVPGERSWMELHGIPCIELEFVDRKLQDSISESRTFPEDITDYDYIRARVAIYSSDCTAKLRRMKGVCRQVGVFLSTNPFRADLPHRTLSLGCELADWTDDTHIVASTSVSLLDRIYQPLAFKRAGIWLAGIRPKDSLAPSLFDDHEALARQDHLMEAVDTINAIPGHPLLKLASQITCGTPGHNDGYSSSFQAPRR